MKLLLAEDNSALGEAIQTALEREHYVVDWLQDGESALNAALHHPYELIVLDLGLPKKNGLEVLRTLRARKISTPTLILTARDTLDDKVQGLDAGADDFLTKPFELPELLARLRALQRRAHQQQTNLLVHGEIQLDTADHRVTYQGREIHLSRREYTLLRHFLERPGKIYARDQLESLTYGWGDDVSSNAIEVHIHNLRKKFYPDLIRTVRGVGYMGEKNSA